MSSAAVPVEVVFEPFGGKPYDLFFFRLEGRRYVGRKTPFRFDGGARKCALMDAGMLLGEVVREQVGAEGVAVHYRPLEAPARQDRFRRLAEDPQIEIYHPFPRLSGDRREPCRSEWIPTPEDVEALDRDEEVMRRAVVELLSGRVEDGAVLYDPACSTGRFLSTLKRSFPSAVTVGQDRSGEMVEHCASRLDRVFHSDASSPALGEGEADFVFCRFLNLDVVTTAQAHGLFVPLAKRCREGGLVVVFGHTPVLLSEPFFRAVGLEVLGCSAASRRHDAVFQLYVLRRTGELRQAAAWWPAGSPLPSGPPREPGS